MTIRRTFSIDWPPQDDVVREPILSFKLRLSHNGFPLNDHVKFYLEGLRNPLRHAVLIALADDSDDKVHKDDISDYHNDQPHDPENNFEVALTKAVKIKISDWRPQCNNKISDGTQSIVFILINFEKYAKEHTERKYDHQEEKSKLLEVFDYIVNHLDLVAEFLENSEVEGQFVQR